MLARASESDEAAAARIAANARYGDTTIPGFPNDPPETVVVPPGNDPSVAGQDAVEGPIAELHEENHEEGDEQDYATTPIPADQFEVFFPPGESGLDPVTFNAAKELGAAIVAAQVGGIGRERFPGYFPGDSWPDPTATNYVGDFATASKVEGHPNLIRTVVIWHGGNRYGDKLAQVRVAQYLAIESGNLKPIWADRLPLEVQDQDGLLIGISIPG
jgi:hypothetical protein